MLWRAYILTIYHFTFLITRDNTVGVALLTQLAATPCRHVPAACSRDPRPVGPHGCARGSHTLATTAAYGSAAPCDANALRQVITWLNKVAHIVEFFQIHAFLARRAVAGNRSPSADIPTRARARRPPKRWAGTPAWSRRCSKPPSSLSFFRATCERLRRSRSLGSRSIEISRNCKQADASPRRAQQVHQQPRHRGSHQRGHRSWHRSGALRLRTRRQVSALTTCARRRCTSPAVAAACGRSVYCACLSGARAAGCGYTCHRPRLPVHSLLATMLFMPLLHVLLEPFSHPFGQTPLVGS
jgi:hypothetical protein